MWSGGRVEPPAVFAQKRPWRPTEGTLRKSCMQAGDTVFSWVNPSDKVAGVADELKHTLPWTALLMKVPAVLQSERSGLSLSFGKAAPYDLLGPYSSYNQPRWTLRLRLPL